MGGGCGAQGVLILGVGGLGCAAVMALAEAGVPRLGLVDDDRVALSNLQRQILFRTSDVGRRKVSVAKERLTASHPVCQVALIPRRAETPEAIASLARHYRVVLDGSDNFPTRFAANDAAVRYGFPLVHGAAAQTRGQVISIAAGGRPCLRCLFDAPPTHAATCHDAGVFGPLVGEVGWLMAMEAVKLLHNVGQPLFGRLLTIDVVSSKRRAVPVPPRPACSVCC